MVLTKKGYYFLKYEMRDYVESGEKMLNADQLIAEIKNEMESEFEMKLNKHEMVDSELLPEERAEFEMLFSIYHNAYLSLLDASSSNS